jgi:hypothetical protein
MATMTGLFDRLRAGQPLLTETTSLPKEKVEQPLKNLELLLDWLLNRWPKDLVTLRDIQAFGPGPVRNKDVALTLMQILSARGWVFPAEPHRYDMKRWEIPRKPTAQPQPTIQLQP